MDKKLREIKRVFENEAPVSFTDHDKQEVLANIRQRKEKSNGKVNHFFPTVITATMITALLFVGLFIINHQFNFIELGYSNGNEDNGEVRSNILLENVISEDEEEYKFEQIPWFSTKQELIDSGHIPSDLADHVTIQADGESIMLNDNIMFKDPQSEAKVIYKFQYDLFIGGEYIIMAEDDEDLVRIGTDLKNKVSKYFPEPLEGTLDGLSEDTIRAIRHGNSQGASWWKGDNNIEYSSFEIGITKTADGEGIIRLSVRPPKLPEELEKELIEKGHLLPHENEDLIVNDLDNNNHKITFDPEIVQIGDVLGDFEIIDIQNHKNEILITFQGNTMLSGDIYYFAKLEFTPDKESLSKLPIANQHIEEEIHFYFQNSHLINKEGATPKIPQNISVDVTGFQYLYSPTLRSSINLDVREYIGVKFEGEDPTETYETTIDLSDELLEIYSQYESSLDDLLLKNLTPIDIFKLYHQAKQMDNQEVVYALFIHDDRYEVPDKETYFNDIAFTESEVMKENDSKYYEELKTVKEFQEVYTEDDEAVITYSTDSSEHGQFFQLIKDNRTNVWKVSWMPIQ